jgi:hypothetical protein
MELATNTRKTRKTADEGAVVLATSAVVRSCSGQGTQSPMVVKPLKNRVVEGVTFKKPLKSRENLK